MKEEKDKEEEQPFEDTDPQEDEDFEDIGDGDGVTGQQAYWGQWSNVTGGTTLTGTYSFGQEIAIFLTNPPVAVVGGGAWDITVSPSGRGRTYSVTATPRAGTPAGSYRLRWLQHSVSNDRFQNGPPFSNVDSAAVNIIVTPTITFSNVRLSGGKLQAQITFSGAGNISGIAATDFQIVNSSGTVQTGWTFDTPPSTATMGSTITIAATPPSSLTGGNYGFRVTTNSLIVTFSDATTSNFPTSNQNSPTIFIGGMTYNSGTTITNEFTTTRVISGIFIGDSYKYILRRDPLSLGTTYGAIRTYVNQDTPIAPQVTDILSTPTRPSGIGSTYTFGYFNGLIRINGSFYVGVVWRSGSNYQSSIESYGSRGTHTGNFIVDTNLQIGDISTFGDKVFITNVKTTGTDNRTIQVRDVRNGNLLHTIPTPSGAVRLAGIAVSSEFIYISAALSGNVWNIITYDHEYNRVSNNDTTTTYTGILASSNYPRYLAISSLNQTTRRPPNPRRLYTKIRTDTSADRILPYYTPAQDSNYFFWQSISLTNRIINATLIKTNFRTTSDDLRILDMVIQKRSGTAGLYTWSNVSTWNYAIPMTGETKGQYWDVRLTAMSSAEPGFYRLLLRANSIETHPEVISDTVELALPELTGTWTEPTGTQTGATANLTLTFSQAVPRSQLTLTSPQDFISSNSNVTITGITPTSGSNTTYTIQVSHAANRGGSYTITLAADAIPATTTYQAGPENALVSDSITFERRSVLTAAWSGISTGTVTTGTTTGTLTFNQAVAHDAFDTTDFSSSNSDVTITAISPSSGSNTVYTITFTHAAVARGSYTITFAEDSIPDGTSYLEGPANDVVTPTISFDTRPQLAVSSFTAASGTQTGNTATFTLDFDRDIPATELIAGDFTRSNTNSSIDSISPDSGNEDTYSITVTQPPNSSGTYTLTLNANTVRGTSAYKQGPTAGFTSTALTFDTRRAVSVASFTAPSGLQGGLTSDFILTLSVPVLTSVVIASKFTVPSGITIDSVTGTNTASGRANIYRVRVNNPANSSGSYAVTFIANAVPDGTTYLQGPSTATTTETINYDTRPAVAVSSFTAPGTTQTGLSSTFRLTLDRAVPTTQLITSKFTGSGGATISSVTPISPSGGNATIYDVVATNPTDSTGSYTISLNVNAIDSGTAYRTGPLATDTLRTSASVTFDTRTAVSVSSFEAPTGTQTGGTSQFTLTLDRSVPSGELDTSEFSATGTATIASISVVDEVSGFATTFRINANNPSTASGTYTLTLAQNAIQTTNTYLQGPTAAESSNAVTYDTRPAVEGSSFTAPSGTQRGMTSVFRLTLDRAVPTAQITTAKFTPSITQSTISTVAGVSISNNMASIYDITVDNPTNASGTYTVSLNANAIDPSTTYRAGPSSAYASESVTYDTRPFTATWQSLVFSSGKLSASISFSHNVTGIEASDFEVINNAVPSEVQTGWTFDTPATGVNTGSSINIAVTPPANTDGSFAMRIKANSVRFDGSSTNNGPDLTTTDFIDVDNRPQLTISSFTTPTGTQGSTSVFTLTFDRSIPATQLNTNKFTIPAGIRISISPDSGNASVYTITATNLSDTSDSYRISLNANTISATTTYKGGPLATDTNRTSESTTYDTRVAINGSWTTVPTSSTTNRITAATSQFTLTLNKSVPVNQITSSDFSGVTIQSITAVSPVNNNASVYNIVVINPSNASGSYVLSFGVNSVSTSITYLQGPSVAVAASALYYDTRIRVSVSSFTAPVGTQTGGTSICRLTLNVSVPTTEITLTDFIRSNTNATLSSVRAVNPQSGSSNVYDITVNNPPNAEASYTISLQANTVTATATYLGGPASDSPSQTITSDTRSVLVVSSFTAPGTTQTGNTADLILTFNRSIPANQLASSDFTVSGTASIDSISPNTGNASSYTIRVTQPTSGNGTYTVTLLANKVESGTSYLAGPSTSFESDTVTYDRRAALTASFTTVPTGTQRGATSTSILTFSSAIPAQLVNSDFTLTNGASINNINPSIGTQAAYNIVTNNPSNASGSYTITLLADKVDAGTGYRKGPSAAVTSSAITFDTRVLDLTVSSFTSPIGTQRGATSVFRLTLNRSVPTSEVTIDDFTVSNSAATFVSVTAVNPQSGSSSVYDITVNNPVNIAANYTLTLTANSIPRGTDYNRGPTTAVQSQSVASDRRTRVEVRSFTAPSGTQTGSTANLTLTFSHSVEASAVDLTDFTPNAVSRTPSTGSSTSYTITVNQPAAQSGTYTVTLSPNTIIASTSYLTGPSSSFISDPVTYDTRSEIAVTSFRAPTGTQTGTSSIFSLVFGVAVPATDLTSADFSGATITNITPTSSNNTTYTITATNPSNASGTYALTLRSNAINAFSTYRSGPSTAFTSTSVTYDTRAYSATWGPARYVTAAQNRLRANISFSHNVSGISRSDFEVIDNASPPVPQSWNFLNVSSSVNANTTLLVAAVPPANTNGSFAIRLKANSLQFDGSGSNNGPDTAPVTNHVAIDNRTAVAVTSFTGPSTEQTTATTTLTLTFDRSVPATELTSADFIISGAGVTINSITPASGNNPTYAIVINNPDNMTGSYSLRLNANAIPGSSSTPYLQGPVNAVNSGTISYNRATIAVPTFDSITGSSGGLRAIISFTGSGVSGISGRDFEVQERSGSVGSYRWARVTNWGIIPDGRDIRSGETLGVNASPNIGVEVNGTFRLVIKANGFTSAGSTTPSSDIPSTGVTVDNRPAAIIRTPATAAWSNIMGGNTLTGRVTFTGANVVGIEPGDFEILNSSNVIQAGWGFTVSTSAVTDGQHVNVTAIPPATVTTGSFKFRLRSESVRSGGSTSNNAPSANTDSTDTGTISRVNLDDKNTFTLTLFIPDNQKGTLDISVNPNSFRLNSDPTNEGPEVTQYLGSIAYDNGEIVIKPAVTITAGSFDSATRTINFHAYWRNASNNQLANFRINSIKVIGSDDMEITSGATPSLGVNMGTVYPITVTLTQSFITSPTTPGRLKLRILAEALGTNTNDLTDSVLVPYGQTSVSPTSTQLSVVITSGSFDYTSKTISFYAYWENASNTQLANFTAEDISVLKPDGMTTVTNAAVALGVAMGSAYPITVTLTDAEISTGGRLKIRIQVNALGNSSDDMLANAVDSVLVPYREPTEGGPTVEETRFSGDFVPTRPESMKGKPLTPDQNNYIGIEFNTTIEGLLETAFEIEPDIQETFLNSEESAKTSSGRKSGLRSENIAYYQPDPDATNPVKPDTMPAFNSNLWIPSGMDPQNRAINRIPAKYWRLDIQVPDPAPRGVITVKLKECNGIGVSTN